jgi:RNA polymerase sigma-70 factor (ECF subfamily)
LLLLAPLADALSAFAPFHLARADMLQRTDQPELARAAYQSALDLTMNTVERDFIIERIAALGGRLLRTR